MGKSDSVPYSKIFDITTLQRWLYVSWFDFAVRYRRTALGPLWLLVGPVAFIAFLGGLFASVGSVNSTILVPSMAVGLIVWTLIGGFTGQSATVFQRNRAPLLQGSMDPIEIVIVDVMTTLMKFLHQIVIIVGVFFLYRQPLTLYSLYSLFGLVLVIANGFWLTMVFGIVGARYRDLSQVMTAILQIAFLATPIIWVAGGSGRGSLFGQFLLFNPFYHFLEIIRAPLLGQSIAPSTWIIVFVVTGGGFALMHFMYRRFGRLVPLWV